MDAPYVFEYAVPVTFPASQADAFAALSDEKALKVWFAEHAEIGPGGVPVSEQLADRALSLPLHAELRDDQVDRILDADGQGGDL